MDYDKLQRVSFLSTPFGRFRNIQPPRSVEQYNNRERWKRQILSGKNPMADIKDPSDREYIRDFMIDQPLTQKLKAVTLSGPSGSTFTPSEVAKAINPSIIVPRNLESKFAESKGATGFPTGETISSSSSSSSSRIAPGASPAAPRPTMIKGSSKKAATPGKKAATPGVRPIIPTDD